MSRFWAAVRFLTLLPLPAGWGEEPEDLKSSTPFFPVVGMLIGAVAAGWTWGVGYLFSDLAAGVLIAVLLLAASRGLHMDGLSDTADAFFSSRRRERMLEIMKDSHVGAMGVVAVVSVFALKAATLAELSQEVRWRCVFLMPVAGRCALVVSLAVLPYARSGGGLGTLFYQGRPRIAAAGSLVLLGLLGWGVGGTLGLIAAAVSAVVTLLLGLYAYRKIGGATGDTLGAVCEVVECVPALTFAARADL